MAGRVINIRTSISKNRQTDFILNCIDTRLQEILQDPCIHRMHDQVNLKMINGQDEPDDTLGRIFDRLATIQRLLHVQSDMLENKMIFVTKIKQAMELHDHDDELEVQDAETDSTNSDAVVSVVLNPEDIVSD